MKTLQTAFILILTLTVSSAAFAHKRWFLPSHTVVSSEDTEWVAVDFTASNYIFYVDSPMPLSIVSITTPAGETQAPLNPSESKRRSTFDVELADKGTYRVYSQSAMYFAAYKLPGEAKPVRKRHPSLEKLQADIPAEATDTMFMESISLLETFLTKGSPDNAALALSGKGLEIEYLTHPNDLYADEPAKLRVLLNGEPAKNLPIEIFAEGSRYRDTFETLVLSSDENGELTVNWPHAGRYLIETGLEMETTDDPVIKERFYGYMATLEVLAP